MARTRTHKLILTGTVTSLVAAGHKNGTVTLPPAGATLFFNLTDDPLELHDLAGSPQAEPELQRLKAAIANWRPPKVPKRFVDLQAPQIRGPNVPPPGLEHRQAIIDYYDRKMKSPSQ